MTAAVRLAIGEIRTVDAAWMAFSRLVAEICAVAEADGHPVPRAAQERAVALAQAVEPGSFSPLHDDLVAGRRMELEALHGFVVHRPPSTVWPCPRRKRCTPSCNRGPSATSPPAPKPHAVGHSCRPRPTFVKVLRTRSPGAIS